MNTVEHTEYKSTGQLPIIVLLLILSAFKYYNGVEKDNKKENEKAVLQTEVSGVATTGTQDMLIQTSSPLN